MITPLSGIMKCLIRANVFVFASNLWNFNAQNLQEDDDMFSQCGLLKKRLNPENTTPVPDKHQHRLQYICGSLTPLAILHLPNCISSYLSCFWIVQNIPGSDLFFEVLVEALQPSQANVYLQPEGMCVVMCVQGTQSCWIGGKKGQMCVQPDYVPLRTNGA